MTGVQSVLFRSELIDICLNNLVPQISKRIVKILAIILAINKASIPKEKTANNIQFKNTNTIELTIPDAAYNLFNFNPRAIANAISWWFINSVNRYIILYFLGQESNGVYALSSRLAMALYAVNSIFNLAWQESAITEFKKEDRDHFYSTTFNKYFVLEMSIIILLIPLSKLYVLKVVE